MVYSCPEAQTTPLVEGVVGILAQIEVKTSRQKLIHLRIDE
jgi:hypothetical protein